ncbi:B-cell linker protein isoform X2 [Conger conger]|uniref:B-cell linker protein isoform X2 n=1 Tax=Conger conger TaxID=82655 RepID=UPI002A5A6CE3|nr:B-cell linker protein isoform X2 [Conger conger]
MSSVDLPTREQCESWNPVQVANLLTQYGMHDCSAAVMRLKIDGLWFLNLSDSDLRHFSLLQLPQLQKMVEGIKKNDGSIMNRLKRLKKKPPPKLPTRDYNADDNEDGDEWSGSEFDSDTYEDPLEDHDDSYEPPPSEQEKRVFSPATAAAFPRGEYVDSLRSRSTDPPRHPARPPRDHTPLLPPKRAPPEDNSEDYIDPEEGEDDNYIDPSEKPAPERPSVKSGFKPATSQPPVPSTKLERSHSPDVYEVPDQEENSTPVSRSSVRLRPPAQRTPPRASPRLHTKKPLPAAEPVGDGDEDEYEVCDPDESENAEESSSPSLTVPTPRPRALNKPGVPAKPSSLLPKREHEARPMAMKQNVLSTTPSNSASARARSPLRQRTPPPLQQTSSPKAPADCGATAKTKKGPSTAEEEAGVYKKSWYANTCDRRSAEEALTRSGKEGAYLVRKSSGQDPSQPYTLVVFYNSRVYNIPIRHVPASRQYALGREKTGEERFSSVCAMIEHHQRKALVLIDSQHNTKDYTKLLFAVKP